MKKYIILSFFSFTPCLNAGDSDIYNAAIEYENNHRKKSIETIENMQEALKEAHFDESFQSKIDFALTNRQRAIDHLNSEKEDLKSNLGQIPYPVAFHKFQEGLNGAKKLSEFGLENLLNVKYTPHGTTVLDTEIPESPRNLSFGEITQIWGNPRGTALKTLFFTAMKTLDPFFKETQFVSENPSCFYTIGTPSGPITAPHSGYSFGAVFNPFEVNNFRVDPNPFAHDCSSFVSSLLGTTRLSTPDFIKFWNDEEDSRLMNKLTPHKGDWSKVVPGDIFLRPGHISIVTEAPRGDSVETLGFNRNIIFDINGQEGIGKAREPLVRKDEKPVYFLKSKEEVGRSRSLNSFM
jgi:hypothetical protein